MKPHGKIGRTWKNMTPAEKNKVCLDFDTGNYSVADLSNNYHRSNSTIYTILKKGGRVIPERTAKAKPRQAKPVASGKARKPLPARYQTLHPEELKLLTVCKNGNEFIQTYFQTLGFGVKTANTIRDIWTYRNDILDFEAEKNKVKPAKKEIREHCDEDVGSTPSVETLIAHTNNLLAECVQLHKEMLAIAKNQYQHFVDIQNRYEKSAGANR